MITTFETNPSRTKAFLRRGLLAAAAMTCTLLASANTPVQPERMTAPPAPHTAAAAHAQPFATDRYVKGATRPRFAVPTGKTRLPHVDALDYTVGSPSELAKALPASSGSNGLNALPAPTPADVAQTDEVVFTPAIQDLANSLNHNPVAITNWVRDHIVFVPTYGSVQGADATLATHRGNAFDTASLLIALLRASNVPARFAYGTVEIPAAAAQNWVGNVAAPEAAVALFAQGGIPVQGVLSGGSVTSIRIEHVWVEAYVDFDPSRGGIENTATTWTPLDASYKQYNYSAGMAVRSGVPVDTATLGAQLLQGATQSPGSVAALNTSALTPAYADFSARVASYIAAQKSTATVADVLGTQAVVAEDLPVLAGSLPYKTIVLGAVYADLPDALRWKLQYGVFASDYDRTQGNAIATTTVSLPKLIGKRLTLSFAGASASDANQLAGLLGATPPASVSAATIKMTAQLALDGSVVASGGSVPFGTTLVGGVGVFEPALGAWSYTPDSHVVAGETHAIAAIGSGAAPSQLGTARDALTALSTQLTANHYTGLTQDTTVGTALHYAALAYATTVAGSADVACNACGIVSYPLPTLTRVHTVANVTSTNGIPTSVAFRGLALDTEMLARTAVARDNNAAHALNFQRTFGERASAYAHLVLDALFTDASHSGRTASTVRALDAANAAKQPLFEVTPANSASVLPQLSVDAGTLGDIQDAIGAGRSAIVSQGAVSIGSWSGVGYVLEDSATGAGDYDISGREQAELDLAGGALPFALSGYALTGAQPSAYASALQSISTAETGYYTAAVALLADYGSVAWTNFVGAPVALEQWWLCALWDGLPGTLGDPGTGVVSSIGTVDFTNLPGAPNGNDPPYFTSAPVISAVTAQPYRYFAMAVDPNGDPLTFSLVSGPNGMTMSATGLVSWPNPLAGTYPVTLQVSDGTANVTQTFTLSVGPVAPLDLSLGIAPQFVAVGDTVTITVATTGGAGSVTRSLKVDGASVALDANGQAKITGAAAGAHVVIASATDSNDTLSRTSGFGVAVTGDTAPPTVAINTPSDGDVITAPVSVTGTVSDANLMLWQLLESPTGQGQWHELARGTSQVSSAALASFDPTQLANGQYDLNLIATDANGQSNSAVVHVIVQGQLKLGLFTVSFNDLSLDVGGVPLTVTRTYDSRKKDQIGDFGYGWTLGYQNIQLQRNRPLGEQWELYQPDLVDYCVRPVGKRVVSVALADGKVHQFDVDPVCAQGQSPSVFPLSFTPRAGTTSTLAPLDGVDLLYQNGTVLDSNTGIAFDSVQYLLTTLDNYQYILQSSDGANTFQIVQITDPNGEVLSITKSGVTSSNGAAIQFTRDGQGRITAVTDPAGRTVKYAYTLAGDLDNITSPLNQVSRNQYAAAPAALAHLLTSYTDASGTQQLRNEYDATGKLIAQYDALGNKVDMSQRDLPNHTQKVTDRNGNTTTYTFDDQGNITQTVDAAGGVTKATFDSYGNQLTATDPLGRTTTTTYDTQSGTVLGTKDALGHTTTQSYNFYTMMGNHTPQQLLSSTDELGHATLFGYTDSGMLRAIVDPLGHTTSFGWGGKNFDQLAQMTDATGNTTHFVNDDQGRKIQETDALGNVTKYAYDAAGHLISTTKTRVVNGASQTLTTTNTVDADGNLLAITDALGNVTQSTWTAQGQIATQTDALGRVTNFTYDTTGRPTKTTYPDGTSESTTYDADGNTRAQTDRAGRVTKTTYDALNQPRTVTNPDGSTTLTSYDSAGQVASATDKLNRTVQFAYDAVGRKTQSIYPNAKFIAFGYDDAGNLTSVSDALNHMTQYIYDAGDRKIQTIWPDGTANAYGYDAAGRKTSDTDPMNRTAQYGYDSGGRVNQVTDALGRITKFGYDELGNKTAQTDALGHVTTWVYDELGRATSHSLPDNRYETMAYDAVGHLTNKTDYAGGAAAFSYDASDRVTTERYPDGTVIGTTYTLNGQVATRTQTANGVAQTIQYSYDPRDRLTDIREPDNAKLHYDYDAAGQKTGITLTTPDGVSQAVAYTYDDNGNLKVVTLNGKTFTYTYDASNRKIERDDPNGVVTKYTYDANGRLVSWTATQGSGASVSIIDQGTYTRNAAGQRTALTYLGPDGKARNISYTYDGAGRLISETRDFPAHAITWTLDATGNRVGQTSDGQASTYAYDVTDRLTAIAGADSSTYAWDENGQLAGKTQNGQTTSYTFNALGQFTSATLPDGTKIEYFYAADGNIAGTSKTPVGGVKTTTHYLVDPNLKFAQVVAEYDDAGHISASFAYGDELLARTKNGVDSYFEHDGHGSVVALTDSLAGVLQTRAYDAWGNVVENTGSDTNPYGYTGERIDVDTGFIYLRARWYEPSTGRFTQPDAFVGEDLDPTSLHRYIYAANQPTQWTDPSGNMTLTETGVAQDIQSTLLTLNRTGGTILRVYNRFEQFKSYMDLLGSISKVISMGAADFDNIRPIGASAILSGVDIKAAVESASYYVPRSVMIGVWDWATGYIRSAEGGAKVSSFFINMPMPVGGLGEVSVPTGITVPFLGQKVPVRLKFGSDRKRASGQLIGFGAVMKIDRQLVRMDYHPLDPNHGGNDGVKGNEIAVLKDGAFHYHVNKWR